MKTKKLFTIALTILLILIFTGSTDAAWWSRFTPACQPTPPPATVTYDEDWGACFLWHDMLPGHDSIAMAKYWRGVEKLGTGTVRYDLHRSLCELAAGDYDWSRPDEFFAAKAALPDGDDIRVIISVYSTADWDREHTEYLPQIQAVVDARGVKRNVKNGPPSSTPTHATHFRDFITVMVDRYEDQGLWAVQFESEIYSISQLLPEPVPTLSANWLGTMDEYIELVKKGYAGVQAANATTEIVMAGLTVEPWAGVFPATLATVIAGCDIYVTKVDFHMYECQSFDTAKVTQLQALMTAGSYDQDIVVLEMGELDTDCDLYAEYSGAETITYEEKQVQADALDLRLRNLYSLGVTPICVLRIGPFDDPSRENPGSRWFHMGLQDFDENIYFSFQSYKDLIAE